MKIGLFGGSFDPIHEGHIITALKLLSYVDKVIFIPTYFNPLKQHKPMFSESERLKLIRKVCDMHPNFDYSDYDVVTKNTSTVKTLQHMSNVYNDHKLYWIMGDDAFDNLRRWNNWKELFKYATLLVVERNQSLAHTLKYADSIAREINKEFHLGWTEDDYPIILLYDLDIPQISSTLIRNKLKSKEEYINNFEQILSKIRGDYVKETKETSSK
jgi:nicotinate-nucleotide adenylyltransferase